jgi:hypothetical protein
MRGYVKGADLFSSYRDTACNPAYDVLHLGGEIDVMMDHLPGSCFSAIDIRDATPRTAPLVGHSWSVSVVI